VPKSERKGNPRSFRHQPEPDIPVAPCCVPRKEPNCSRSRATPPRWHCSGQRAGRSLARNATIICARAQALSVVGSRDEQVGQWVFLELGGLHQVVPAARPSLAVPLSAICREQLTSYSRPTGMDQQFPLQARLRSYLEEDVGWLADCQLQCGGMPLALIRVR